MDRQLVNSLIVASVAAPYVVEVVRQVPLLTRVMKALPDDVRRRLPPHPRRPGLAVFGSARFFVTLFRYALRDDAGDGPEMRRLKRDMRRSAVREGASGVLFAATVAVLWHRGWRLWG